MTDLKQMNLKVEAELANQIDALAEAHDWSKTQTIRLGIYTLARLMASDAAFAGDAGVNTAIRTVRRLMERHRAFAETLRERGEHDLAELYLRLAREMPGELADIPLPKDRLRGGHAAGVPAFLLDDHWLVFWDPEADVLLAEEQGGQRRVARIVDGEIRPLAIPAAAEFTAAKAVEVEP
jgi:hypothetical protein